MKFLQFFSCFLRSSLAALVIAPIFNAAALRAKEPPPDTCSLLPPSQLQRIFDQPFGEPDRSKAPAAYPGQPSGTECDYQTQKGFTRKVVFIAYVDPSAAQAKQTYEKLSMWFAPRSKPAGIGDSAYIDDNHAIHVLKGRVRYYINIIPIGTITPEKEKQLRDLAAWVAAQIS
jgi:hypothetical protein